MNGKNFLIISKNTEAALSYIKSATELLRSRGCNVFCLSEKASFFDGLDIAPISSDKLKHINIALVFGGDGTILKAGRLLISYKIPILGINMDSTVIAALLTILGYSINATIIVFDRVRENNKNYDYVLLTL